MEYNGEGAREMWPDVGPEVYWGDGFDGARCMPLKEN